MTKVINKKALLVLLTLVLAFCWLSVPVSASEVVNEAGYVIGNGELIFVSPDDGVAGRSITGNLLDLFVVYAAKEQADGTYAIYTINSDYPLVAGGPANILNIYLPDGYYETMQAAGLDYFYCEVTFQVSGSNLKRVKVDVDDVVVADGAVASGGGTYTVKWVSPRRETTTFRVIVYDNNNVSSVSWGHIYRNR